MEHVSYTGSTQVAQKIQMFSASKMAAPVTKNTRSPARHAWQQCVDTRALVGIICQIHIEFKRPAFSLDDALALLQLRLSQEKVHPDILEAFYEVSEKYLSEQVVLLIEILLAEEVLTVVTYASQTPFKINPKAASTLRVALELLKLPQYIVNEEVMN